MTSLTSRGALVFLVACFALLYWREREAHALAKSKIVELAVGTGSEYETWGAEAPVDAATIRDVLREEEVESAPGKKEGKTPAVPLTTNENNEEKAPRTYSETL